MIKFYTKYIKIWEEINGKKKENIILPDKKTIEINLVLILQIKDMIMIYLISKLNML